MCKSEIEKESERERARERESERDREREKQEKERERRRNIFQLVKLCPGKILKFKFGPKVKLKCKVKVRT